MIRPTFIQRMRRSLSYAGAALRALAPGQMLPPWEDYWYQNRGFDSAAGMNVSPETAMRLSAVYACVRVRSETLGSCQGHIYKRQGAGGHVRAPEHPLYQVLHGSPNIWQTAFEWVEMQQAHLDLRGNAFSLIVPGDRGAVDQLVPLHPDLVNVYRLPNGKLKYQVRSRFSAEVRWYMMEEILHLRGLSSDGLVGLSPVALQREMIGNGLAMQDYQGRFLANDTATKVWMKHPGRFKDDATREKFRDNYQKSQTQANRGKVPVLENGMELKTLGISHEDAQFLQSFQASREEICSIYRIPPHKIAILQRSTNNNIEQQGIEFVQDCMQPIAARWERRINADLVAPINAAMGAGEDEYFFAFDMSNLERGDLLSRYKAYSIGRNWGWLSPNRICEFEGMNPLPEGQGGDDYLRPINMQLASLLQVPAGATVEPDPEQTEEDPEETESDEPPSPDSGDDDAGAQHGRRLLAAFATEAARRVVRKEVTALRKTLARSAKDTATFAAEAASFYESHIDLVAQTMCISRQRAQNYAENNFRLLSEIADPGQKSAALDWIEDTAPRALTEIALAGARKPAAKTRKGRQPINVTIEPQSITVNPAIMIPAPPKSRSGSVSRRPDGSFNFEMNEGYVESAAITMPVGFSSTRRGVIAKNGDGSMSFEAREDSNQ